MKLSTTIINLVGIFKCTIDNSIAMCAGIDKSIYNEAGELVADAYIWDLLDTKNNLIISPSIIVVFNQVGDNIKFLHKKDIFDVIAITDNLITVRKEDVDYFIEKITLPSGLK